MKAKSPALFATMDNFGQIVKAERKARGWSQKEFLSKLVDKHINISMLEAGVRIPRYDTFVQILDALDLKMKLVRKNGR